MATDPRLENYLESLERALKPLPTSDRAEIVTEIKSHVLSALERDSQKPLDDVLHALGAPETVANRYLMERGAAPVKPPISPIVKWLVIGFLGTLAMMLVFLGFVVYQAKHYFRGQNVEDFMSNGGKWSQFRFGIGDVNHFSGFVTADGLKSAQVRFNTGKITLIAGEGSGVDWDCNASLKPSTLKPPVTDGKLDLDFTSAAAVKCTVRIPAKLSATIEGTTGKVIVDARPANQYRYSLHVSMGKVDEFPQTTDAKLPEIQVNLSTGKIQNDSASSGAEE